MKLVALPVSLFLNASPVRNFSSAVFLHLLLNILIWVIVLWSYKPSKDELDGLRQPKPSLCEYPYEENKAIGFNVETVQYNNIKFQVWDLGGQTSIRPYWRCYFPNTQAIIYVVDSSDVDRLVIAKDEFHAILEEEELRGAIVLIFANKQDLPGALDDAAVTEALELHKIKNRQWAIFKTSAIKGEGLFEGLDWLSNTLKSGGG